MAASKTNTQTYVGRHTSSDTQHMGMHTNLHANTYCTLKPKSFLALTSINNKCVIICGHFIRNALVNDGKWSTAQTYSTVCMVLWRMYKKVKQKL